MEVSGIFIAEGCRDTLRAKTLAERFAPLAALGGEGELFLRLDEEGLALCLDGKELKGDFSRLLPRVSGGKLAHEMLVKAARIKNPAHPLTAADATAGLGEDSFFLAAAGFEVTLFEQNAVVFSLLEDALSRALKDEALYPIVSKMHAVFADSVQALSDISPAPDVILLDPMFPERQKSALVKKKLQMIQLLEAPCQNEEALLLAAAARSPQKLIIKRPPKGPYLGGIKPDFSLTGKAVRFDCILFASKKLHLE